MSWFTRKIAEIAAEAATKAVKEHLDKRIPEIIADSIRANPNAPLSKAGFGWALALALRKFWPAISMRQASAWLWDYVDVPFGARGYAWTAAGADEVARQYVEQFGEAA